LKLTAVYYQFTYVEMYDIVILIDMEIIDLFIISLTLNAEYSQPKRCGRHAASGCDRWTEYFFASVNSID